MVIQSLTTILFSFELFKAKLMGSNIIAGWHSFFRYFQHIMQIFYIIITKSSWKLLNCFISTRWDKGKVRYQKHPMRGRNVTFCFKIKKIGTLSELMNLMKSVPNGLAPLSKKCERDRMFSPFKTLINHYFTILWQ